MTMHDDIRRQLMWSRLIAVVEEQARMLMLTAFSATVREAGDLSAGVFDLRGRMVAQAITGTPGHVNSMAEAVPHFLKEFPIAEMREGDHFVTNDPWIASGHLHDITVVSPVFRNGRPLGFFSCTCHQVDIGGMGQGPDGRSVFEEGLYIPPMHLARAGTPNADLLRLIHANVRQPRMVEGDVLSYVTTNEASGRRLVKMLDEFGEDGLEDLADWIFERSRKAMIAEIRKLPRGTYENELVLDGYDKPVKLKAALTIGEDDIRVDYTGSDPASPYGINVVLNYCKAYSAFGVRCVVAPRVPNNAGSLAPIVVTAPEGSIVNVKHPWPVSARHVIGQFLPDVMLGCLAKAVPERIPAEGAACLWGAQLRGGPSVAAGAPTQSNRIGEPFEVMFFNSGGSGGRPFADGMNATAFPSGVRALPAEVVETVAPVVIWKKELRPDSAGAGRYRGGLGQTVEVGTIDGAPFGFFAMFDRVKSAPRGRAGGANGTPGRVETASGAKLRAMGLQVVAADERLRLSLPGGAGYGDPFDRPPAHVAADVADGIVAREAAERDYGVVLRDGGAVDEAATAALRAQGARRAKP
ncbi:MAG TPA: hydantoinase B/oxoprolinase family protein [Alphaproteobacteria bacterium]|jgi:N-methylhydantoinase B/oxoprolinase/acetone carboxylase alpha subunit